MYKSEQEGWNSESLATNMSRVPKEFERAAEWVRYVNEWMRGKAHHMQLISVKKDQFYKFRDLMRKEGLSMTKVGADKNGYVTYELAPSSGRTGDDGHEFFVEYDEKECTMFLKHTWVPDVEELVSKFKGMIAKVNTRAWVQERISPDLFGRFMGEIQGAGIPGISIRFIGMDGGWDVYETRSDYLKGSHAYDIKYNRLKSEMTVAHVMRPVCEACGKAIAPSVWGGMGSRDAGGV